MGNVITRAEKGSPLTNAEVDSNFTNLKTDKADKSANLSDLADITQAKVNLGLGNVSNTSDADKPVSLAAQAALDLKSDTSHLHDDMYEGKNLNIQTHIASTENPHGVSKAQVGLGDVDNTSDINKPISTAQQAALNLKLNTSGGAINANTATAALRITQTGTGNALIVEDTASPDVSPFVIDATGKGILGNTISQSAAYPGYTTNYAAALQLQSSASGVLASISLTNADAGGVSAGQAPALSFNRTGGNGLGDRTQVQNGVVIGSVGWGGSDGETLVNAAAIFGAVDGAPAIGSMPGRLVFSTTPVGSNVVIERMRINSDGLIGIGQLPQVGTLMRLGGNITGNVTSQTLRIDGTVQSNVTGLGRGIITVLNTAAVNFSTNLSHFQANQGTIGAGSTVTSQFGFEASASLIGATYNYGFYSSIPVGTNRWNFYAGGTADNYFAGNVGIGGTPTTKLDVANSSAVDTYVRTRNSAATFGYDIGVSGSGAAYVFNRNNSPLILGSNGTERLRIEAAGNVLVTSASCLGYGGGAGGTVTQATSKSTAVTLNKPVGQITLANTALAAGAVVTFPVSNSLVSGTDVIVSHYKDGGTAQAYQVWVDSVYANGFTLSVKNLTGASLSEAITLNFAVIKGSAA